MPLAPIDTASEPTTAEIGIGIAATAYATALMMRDHWLEAYRSWFERDGWTVADLQAMTDGIDAAAIADHGQRNAYEMLKAHHLLQQALRTALPPEIMANDPTQSPVPYTLEEDEHGQRFVWQADARYPTEPEPEPDPNA